MTEEMGLYLVMTEPKVGYLACARAAVQARVRYLQLRMKDPPLTEILEVAASLRALTRGTDTRLIINDDVRVARAVDADGLHLGQSDMSLGEARRAWPGSETKLFGLSTHDEEQARAAIALSPSYIGVGPVFATPTKRVPDPVLGLARARAIIADSPLPCVAIGGIDLARARELRSSGLRNFAVVRAVCSRPDPEQALEELREV